MIDLTPWKNADSDWLEQRKENWRFIAKHLEIYECVDYKPGEEKQAYENYYFGLKTELLDSKKATQLCKPTVSWQDCLVLHPNPSQENISNILQSLKEKGYQQPFASSYQFPLKAWQYYLENDFTPVSLCSNYMEVVFGDTFEDTLRINQLTVEEHGAEMFVNLFFHMRGSICDQTGYSGTIDRWIKLYFSAIPYISDEQFLENHFNTKRIFKFLKRYEHITDYKIEERLEMVNFIRKKMIANRDQYCSEIQKCIDDMQQYFVDNNIALD